MVVPAINTMDAKMTEITLPITPKMRRASEMFFLVGLVRYLSIMLMMQVSRCPAQGRN